MLALLACTGLIASFHTIIFAYGRQIYSLSRAGYFPTWLSVTHGTRADAAPRAAGGSALGFAVALAIHLTPQGSPVGAMLLNMAVFGAVLAYILQMASFILLRVRFPSMSGPTSVPWAFPAPRSPASIAAVTLVMLFRNPDYNKGVIGAAVWFLLGIGYYAVYARHRLVLAPEEEAAFDPSAGEVAVMNLPRTCWRRPLPRARAIELAGIAAGHRRRARARPDGAGRRAAEGVPAPSRSSPMKRTKSPA